MTSTTKNPKENVGTKPVCLCCMVTTWLHVNSHINFPKCKPEETAILVTKKQYFVLESSGSVSKSERTVHMLIYGMRI